MIDKKTGSLIIIGLAIVAGFFLFKKKSGIEVKSTGMQIENAQPAGEEIIVKKAMPSEAKKTQFSAENLKKCGDFLSEQSANDIATTLQQIKTKYKMNEKLEITEYQLLGPNNEQIVVQSIPQEEIKNQIRVFKTAADGFPDRIKDFVGSGGSVEERLQGALALGHMQTKIEKFEATASGGVRLNFERSENKIIKLRLSEGRTQLTCEDGKCHCESF